MRVGLSLGAGGARGWTHLGVVKALEETGIHIDLVNGSSIGAVVGGAYALYQNTNKMFAIAKEAVDSVDVNYFNIFRHSNGGESFLHNVLINAICDIAALHSSLISHRNNIKALKILFADYEFKHTKIPFSAVTTDLVSGKLVSIQKGKLVDGILPSISIPGIFPPIKRGGHLLVDGGVLSNVPVYEIRKCKAEFVIAVRLINRIKAKYKNGFDILNYVDSLKFNEITRNELKDANFVIEVDTSKLDGGKFDEYDSAISTGYSEAMERMPELMEKLENVSK